MTMSQRKSEQSPAIDVAWLTKLVQYSAVTSSGGAGTFDGIFLTGIVAVLLAGLYHPRQRAAQL